MKNFSKIIFFSFLVVLLSALTKTEKNSFFAIDSVSADVPGGGGGSASAVDAGGSTGSCGSSGGGGGGTDGGSSGSDGCGGGDAF